MSGIKEVHKEIPNTWLRRIFGRLMTIEILCIGTRCAFPKHHCHRLSFEKSCALKAVDGELPSPQSGGKGSLCDDEW